MNNHQWHQAEAAGSRLNTDGGDKDSKPDAMAQRSIGVIAQDLLCKIIPYAWPPHWRGALAALLLASAVMAQTHAAGFSFNLPNLKDMVSQDVSGGSGGGRQAAVPSTCPADFQKAKTRLQQADQAAAARRWQEAVTAYDQAESQLNEVAAKCSGDEAVDATSLGDALPARREAARKGLAQGGTAAASSASSAVAPTSPACQGAKGKAIGFDNAAATALEKQDWPGPDQALAQAEAAWGEAAQVCESLQQESAQRNQADSARARQRLADKLIDPKACNEAFANAKRMVKLADTAKADGQSDDVSLWQRKAETAWGVAVEKCRGEARAEAQRQQAALAGINQAAPEPGVDATPPVVPEAEPAATPPGTPATPPQSAPPSSVAPVPTADLPTESITLKVGDTTFSGRFRKDASGTTLSGEGRVSWDNGNLYLGPLVQGKAQGRGTMNWASGDRYEGDWQDDLPHGRGVLNHANGDRYEGEFVRGEATGRGRISFANGSVYEGEVRNSLPEGRGSYRWPNGDRFEGQWQAGKKQGQGRHTWANGDAWEGEYRDDRQTDNGHLIRAAKP